MLRKLFTNNIDNIKHIGYTTFVNAIRTNAINNIQELKGFGFNLREDINNAPFEDNAFQARLQPILLNLRVNVQQDIEPELKLELEGLYNEIVLSVNEEVLYDKITELSQNGSDVNINDLFEDLDSKLQMPNMPNTTQTTFSNKNVTAPNKSSFFGNKLTRSFSTVEKENLIPDATIIKKTPKISIGGDFKDLVTKSDVFIDKSLFIKEIFEDPAEAILITMPRRWGKSLNLDMLKRFLSIDHVEKDTNKILFEGGKLQVQEAFSKVEKDIPVSKLIQQNPQALYEQGQYPIIHLDFKDCKGSSLDDIKGNLKKELVKTLEKFGSTLKHSTAKFGTTEIYVKEKYEEILQNTKNGDFSDSLKYLSALLHAHHGKKVWILIDEYDAAANKAYLEVEEAEAKTVGELFRSIYESALKGNEHLEKGVMTGVQYIVKSGMLSGLNNLSKYNITNSKYSQYYGINQQEIKSLLDKFKVEKKEALSIQDWYNGYKENQGTQENPEYIGKYNIWSLVNYLNRQEDGFKSYWEQTGSVLEFLEKLFKNPEVKQKLENLTNGHFLHIKEPTTDFSLENFRTLKKIKDGIDISELHHDGVELFFSYLLITGYLTLNEQGLSLPNQEIKKEMSNYLKSHYSQIFNIAPEKFSKLTNVLSKVLLEEDSKKVKELFEKEFAPGVEDIISKLNLEKVWGNEDMVHSLLNNIALQVVNAEFATERNTTKPSGYKGRADIVLSKHDTGVLIEMKYDKYVTDSTKGHKVANSALDQAKTYAELVKDDALKIFVGCNVTDQQQVFIAGSIEQEGQDAITFEYPPSC